MAGRRFLEALRQHHDEMYSDDSNATDVRPSVHRDVKTASAFNFGATPKTDDASELKRKRMSLRISLEELLVEYLRTASVTDDTSNDAINGRDDRLPRVKRSSKSLPQTNSYARKRNVDTAASTVAVDDHIGSMRISSQTVEMPNGSIEIDEDNTADNSNATATNKTRSVCPQRKRRITQLDRTELAKAIQSGSEHEHNIRGLLNYRYVCRLFTMFGLKTENMVFDLLNYRSVCAYFSSQFATQKASEMKRRRRLRRKRNSSNKTSKRFVYTFKIHTLKCVMYVAS